MYKDSLPTHASALWLTDLHLDRASPANQCSLLHRLSDSESEIVLITGDISSGRHLRDHLRQLATACAPRPVYFVLGNHDYYGGCLADVDAQVAQLCAEVGNLHHMDGRHIVPLGHKVCLIGHRGWADARAGYAERTVVHSRDRSRIRDFEGLTQTETLKKMRELGAQSARLIRRILPLALTRYRHVVILTHVPPYPDSVRYNQRACAATHLPHYANLSAGLAIRAITGAFPTRRVTILAGHAHSASVTDILPNLRVRVGSARTGKPNLQQVLQLS